MDKAFCDWYNGVRKALEVRKMLFKRKQKIAVTLTREEMSLVARALNDLRNWAIRQNIPTEDIDKIILKLYK